MPLLRSSLIVSVSALFLASACSSNPVTNDGGTPDSGTDAGPGDAGMDAGVDAGPPPPVGDGGAPAAAPVLSFTTSLTGVQLTWTLPGALGGEQFQVLRADENGSFLPVANAQAVMADAYSDPIASAAPGEVHQYEVTANNGNGLSPPSNIVEVLQAPGDVAAGGSDTRVLLFWGALSNATSYDVYRVPAADAGAPTKLGNVTLSEFIDDGSTAAIAAGSSYSYQVIAQSIDGGQPSTGSNIATAKALGIDISDVVTHVSDLDAGVPVAENSTEGVFGVTISAAGAFSAIDPFSISNASVLPGIDAGSTWYLSYGDGTFYTSETARSVDVGGAVAGRANAAEPINLPAQTVMAYDLLGLDAWTEPTDGGLSDTLQSVSVGAGSYVSGLESALDDGGIGAGATTFVGDESILGHFIDGGSYDAGNVTYFDVTKNDIHLVDSTQGDQYYVTQLHQKTSTTGHVYQAVTKSFTDLALVEADGHSNPIDGTMAVPAPTVIADLKVLNTQFNAPALKALVNPAATNAGQTVSIFASKDFAIYGNYTLSPALLNAPVPGTATTDTDLGAITFGNPFPASWETFVQVKSGFNMTYDLTGDTQPATFESVSTFFQPTVGYDFTSVAPALGPVTNLQVGGKTAFADQVNVTTSPIISWSAPAGSIAPSRYVVSQYELALNGTAVVIGYYLSPELQDLVFTTTATSFKLPATLTTDTDGATHWYFVTVDAIYEKNGSTVIDPLATPFHHGTNYMSAQAVSNKFTEGAGVKAPSHYIPTTTTTRAARSEGTSAGASVPAKLAKLFHLND